MEKKNFLFVKTKRGIEKFHLYKSLEELVDIKEEELNITNSNIISLSNLEENIFPFSYKIDDNAFRKKAASFTYTLSSKMEVFADSKIPPIAITEDKKIVTNIQSFLVFTRRRLVAENFLFAPGEVIIEIRLAGKVFSFANNREIFSFINIKEAMINYNEFPSFVLNEEDYKLIESFYTKQYGKNWRKELYKEISKNVNDFISVYYKKNEQKNNVNLAIRNNEVFITLKDNEAEFENLFVLPMDAKLILKQSVLNFGVESKNVIGIEKEFANKELSEEEFKSALKEVKTENVKDFDGYFVQIIPSNIYELYKNKISGAPILVNNFYVLKTAGTKENIFRSKYDELFFIERDVEKYKISSDFFKENGGVILVCSGAGSAGNGTYGGAGGNGMIKRYEIPSKPKFSNIILSATFCAGASNGASGETFEINDKGEKGGSGGKNVIAILEEAGERTKLVSYGGGGGGGSGLTRAEQKTKGGVGGRDGNNRKINNETDNKFGGKGTDANVYNNAEIYEKNLEDAKIIVGAYLE